MKAHRAHTVKQPAAALRRFFAEESKADSAGAGG